MILQGLLRGRFFILYLDQMPTRFRLAKGNPILQAMLVTLDPQTGHALSIQRITQKGEEEA